MIPEIKVIVYREGETVEAALEEAEMLAEAEEVGEPVEIEYVEPPETVIEESIEEVDEDVVEEEVLEDESTEE